MLPFSPTQYPSSECFTRFFWAGLCLLLMETLQGQTTPIRNQTTPTTCSLASSNVPASADGEEMSGRLIDFCQILPLTKNG